MVALKKKEDLTTFDIIKLAFSFIVASNIVKMSLIYEYLPAYINVFVPNETLPFCSCHLAMSILLVSSKTNCMDLYYFNGLYASYAVYLDF